MRFIANLKLYAGNIESTKTIIKLQTKVKYNNLTFKTMLWSNNICKHRKRNKTHKNQTNGNMKRQPVVSTIKLLHQFLNTMRGPRDKGKIT